jgi:hypothetical protein
MDQLEWLVMLPSLMDGRYPDTLCVGWLSLQLILLFAFRFRGWFSVTCVFSPGSPHIDSQINLLFSALPVGLELWEYDHVRRGVTIVQWLAVRILHV